MFKFLFSQLTHKDKVFAFAKKHRKTIEKLSAKSPYFSKTVKKGFKLMFLWRVFLIAWWGFISLCALGVIFLVYWGITTFVL